MLKLALICGVGPFVDDVTVNLTITNGTKVPMAYKLKTTAPKRYCVRPNSGVLVAMGKEEISSKFFSHPIYICKLIPMNSHYAAYQGNLAIGLYLQGQVFDSNGRDNKGGGGTKDS